MSNSIKVMRVTSITHDVSEVLINDETQAFICRQNNPQYPVVVRLSGGYVLGEYDCNRCAAFAVAELESRVSSLNAKFGDTRGERPASYTDSPMNRLIDAMIGDLVRAASIVRH
ncbi:hypothetical protein [Martelella alba]|uniref:Uncharacterized protein n=1 Tax=Martelella alba TaxID=2590451 RepID=A0ABY2SF69_9HYPH|nr:hypothetical protein [Martelella alba]TKI02568.1 hypothetical protein FCN80_24595 [Martelella alba]